MRPRASQAARTADSRARPDRSLPVTPEHIARAARELVAAYGASAVQLMRKRTHSVRRRGDAKSATLWLAVAQAVEQQLRAAERLDRGRDTGAD